MTRHLPKLYRLARLLPSPPLLEVMALKERNIDALIQQHISNPLNLSVPISWAKVEVTLSKYHQRSKGSQTHFMDLSFRRVVLKPKSFLLRYRMILRNF